MKKLLATPTATYDDPDEWTSSIPAASPELLLDCISLFAWEMCQTIASKGSRMALLVKDFKTGVTESIRKNPELWPRGEGQTLLVEVRGECEERILYKASVFSDLLLKFEEFGTNIVENRAPLCTRLLMARRELKNDIQNVLLMEQGNDSVKLVRSQFTIRIFNKIRNIKNFVIKLQKRNPGISMDEVLKIEAEQLRAIEGTIRRLSQQLPYIHYGPSSEALKSVWDVAKRHVTELVNCFERFKSEKYQETRRKVGVPENLSVDVL